MGALWGQEESMEATFTPILTLFLVLAIAYVVKYFLSVFFRRWYLVTTGLEYIILGLALGPAVAGVVQEETLRSLSPAMSIGIGSIGLLAGLRLNPRKMAGHLESSHTWVSFWIAGTTILVMGGATLWALSWATRAQSVATVWPLLPLTLLVVATAVVSATTPLQYAVEHYQAKGWVSRCIVYVAEFSEVFGILLFGVALSINHKSAGLSEYNLDAVHWFVLQVALGGLLGGLFSIFIGNQEKSDKMLVAVLGIIIFSSGLAYYLKVSPLLINFMVGLVLATTSHFGSQLEEQLEQIEKPFYMVICFLAGLVWRPSWGGGWLLLVVPGYIGLRWMSKWLGGELALLAENKAAQVRGLGRGLLAQGGLSVAMVLSYLQIYARDVSVGQEVSLLTLGALQADVSWPLVWGPQGALGRLTELLTTTILLSILVHETFAVRAARNLLINAGEISPSVNLAGPVEVYDIDPEDDEEPSGAPGEGR